MPAKQEPAPELKKGMLLVIKAAPFFNQPYLYEVTSAGDRLIRVSLFRSPTVKKSWSKEQISILFQEGIISIATEKDIEELTR